VVQQQQSSLLDQLDTTFIKFALNATCSQTAVSGGSGPSADTTVVAFKQVIHFFQLTCTVCEYAAGIVVS
jgi:hypothetical protein